MNDNIENAVLKEAPILPEAELQEEEVFFEMLEVPTLVIDNEKDITLVGNPEQVQALFEAWGKYIAEVENPCNNKDNIFFKASYAPLSEVFTATRPIMGKYGLGVTQVPRYEHGVGVKIQTIITHEKGGAWVFPSLLAPVKVANDVQAVASALTYCKRIALNAIAAVAGQNEDDDANGAVGNKTTKTTTKKPKASKSDVDPALAEARAKLLDLCKKRSGEVADKEEIYKVIVKYCGNRNPNSMQSVEDCTAATEEIKRLK